MIPNHEGAPDEPTPVLEYEDLYQCEDCRDWGIDTPRCGSCGCLVCPECWDEHRITCTDEDHLRGAA